MPGHQNIKKKKVNYVLLGRVLSVSMQSPASLLGLSSKNDDVDEFIWPMIGNIGTLCECGYEHSR